MLLRFVLSLLFCFVFVSPASSLMEYNVTGSFESTQFIFHRDQHSINDYETFEGEFEFVYDNEKYFKLLLKPRLKVDVRDFSRNRYLPNETYALLYSDHLELKAGMQLVSWGVANSFNPTDVINRRDFEDNFYDPEVLGEVVVSFKGVVDQAGPFEELTFEVLGLPYFQQTPLPENDARFAISNLASGARYTLFDTQENPDYLKSVAGAVKIAATIKSVDASLHYYHGPNRNPGYFLLTDTNGRLRLKPFYYTIDMAGVNIESSVGNFTLRFEGAYKFTTFNATRSHNFSTNFEDNTVIPQNFAQFVPGFDYTFHGFFGSGEMMFSIEYLAELNQDTKLRNFRPFKNDLFLGFRYSFLNSKDSQITFGIVKDLANKEAVILSEVSTKIVKDLKLTAGSIFVHRDSTTNTPISFFDNNSHAYAKLSYSFGGNL